MSFKIFYLQLLGKLKSTTKIEEQREVLAADYKEFIKFQDSEELKIFSDLENWVTSGEFKNKKKQLEALRFKGSKEANLLKEYQQLRNKKSIKRYFKLANSSDLVKFEKEKDTAAMKEYIALADYVKSGQFAKDKKQVENIEAIDKGNKYKQLKANDSIRFVLKFGKSSLFQNYLNVKDSTDLKRYYELKKGVESPAFKEKKNWLEDKNRWKRTEEYQKELEYEKQKARPEFVKYFNYKNSADFDFQEKWKLIFQDDFAGSEIDTKKWSLIPVAAEKMLGESYAMPGDLSIFTKGKNLVLSNKLSIQVKKEKTTGKVWQMSTGLVPTNFKYSSGMITSAGKFMFEDGILEAKINFNPVKQIASSFYLAGDEVTPRINLLEMGVKNYLGIASLNSNGKQEFRGLDIKNLKKGSYIFSVEKIGASFTWKINGVKVFQESETALAKSLALNASSLVVHELPQTANANFDIEWVKCYRKK